MVLNVPAITAYEAYQRIAAPASQLDPLTDERWKREAEAIGNAISTLIVAGRAELGL